jgi:hypothetical protein
VWIIFHTRGKGAPHHLSFRKPIGVVNYLRGLMTTSLPLKMKPVKITLVMTAAAAVLVIGMLMTREKGINLRRKIKEGVSDWCEEFSRMLHPEK